MAQAVNQPNPTQIALTPAQIMQLPAAQQQAYVASLNPQMQAIYQQEMINMGNTDFMRNSLEQWIFCPVQGGSGTSAAYSPGTTLDFDLPTDAGYAKGLLIKYDLAVTPANGASATYQLTAAQKWAIFNRIVLNYGGVQINTHPYFLKELGVLQGRMAGIQNSVIAGQDDSAIDAAIVGSTPLVVGSANTWQGYFYLPLNAIGDESPYGLLPLNGVGNTPQLQLTCAPNLYGTDALLNAVCSGGTGTGQAITVTGTIKVDALVLNGSNMESIAAKSLQGLLGMPTMQYGWESNLTPFGATSENQFTIKTKLEHWVAMAIIIDGQQSNAFISSLNNLTAFRISPSSSFQQSLVNIGVGNNISIYDWFYQSRNKLRQDLDEGIILWANASGRGVVNPSNRNGSQAMNCYADGYPGMSHGYTVGAVGSVCTPRVELFLVSKNRSGLQVGS